MKTEEVGKSAEVWEFCLKFIYSGDYIKGLDKFLRERRVKKILDCSCGVGFPSIGLKKLGYDVFCSDGSKEMLERMKANMKKENVKIPMFHTRWDKLGGIFGGEFDLVLCRGNSTPYVDSWGKNSVNTSKAGKDLLKSLRNMFRVLKPGGLLYVDITHRREFESENGIIFERFRRRKINGKDASLIATFVHDRKKRIRLYRPEVLFWNSGSVAERKTVEMAGYLLSHGELLAILKKAGFANVEKYVEIEGEDNYDIFIAHKGESYGKGQDSVSCPSWRIA